MTPKSFNGHQVVHTDNAPKSIGPYSQAIIIPASAQLVYCAGQAALDPTTGEVVQGGIEAQTRQTILNLHYVLEAANSSLAHIVKTNVYLKDMNDFPVMNQIYGEMIRAASAREEEQALAAGKGGLVNKAADYVPARTTVEVARLPKDAIVEIECVATVRQ
ncbi:hypothetical protein BGZ83_010689 [Gryganskiella cystojenkinii]|nr:hypothetical protein BGZ83_010689 [Gryganskiella cystojenkinii]